jgi:fatty-acyl-CoA synthase
MRGTSAERLHELHKCYPAYVPHTLWTRFAENADRYAERTFLIHQERSYTYGEVNDHVNRTAAALYSIGVRAGDHVGVALKNCPEFVYLTFAIAKLGAVKIPFNPKLGADEYQYILRQADADYLFCSQCPQQLDVPSLKKTVLLRDWEGFIAEGGLTAAEDAEAYSLEHQDPMGMSDIMFTSGSTSQPKGVILTHDMLLRSSFGTVCMRRMEFGRRMMIPIPFYHIFAYNEGLLPMLYVGGTIVIADRGYNPENTLYLMKKHQVNDIICVSLVMLHLLEQTAPNPADFPALHAGYWASTCPEWVWDKARKCFGITDVTTGYGMTECGSTTTLLTPDDPVEYVKSFHGKEKEAGAFGMPELGGRLLEVKICDPETGRKLPAGETGEICCRGVTVTPGYYKNPAANAECFTSDGWFKTGDLGRFSKEGYLSYSGRISDVYKINGENVSPQYLDSVISKCPAVKAVEVIGVPDSRHGAVGVAFIDPGSSVRHGEIVDYMKRHLARFQIPKYIFYGKSGRWPRGSSGKTKPSDFRRVAIQGLQSGKNADYLIKETQ